MPGLISVDWGTTSLRCMLVGANGTVLDQTRAERGILKTGGRPFGYVLHDEIASWLGRFESGARVPVIMSGMIGSQQGWQEAAYLRCPAAPRDIARHLSRIDTTGTTLSACDIRIVPGMDQLDGQPDVMRGEETQVLGAMLSANIERGTFVLPGTHSKWVVVENHMIKRFLTFMTGEIYAALLDGTILGRLAEGDHFDQQAFELGVKAATDAHRMGGAPGDLLRLVFSARSRVLIDDLPRAAVRSYLSGLLIGAETLAGAQLGGPRPADTIHVLADEPLRARYMHAMTQTGMTAAAVAFNPVPIAHLEIAKLAGLVA